jgi:hypothetical protein
MSNTISNILKETNKDFSTTKKKKQTYMRIVTEALDSQVRRNDESVKLMGVTDLVQRDYGGYLLSITKMYSLEQGVVKKRIQDNISDWFCSHKDDKVFNKYRAKLPMLFKTESSVGDVPEVEPVVEQVVEPVVEQATVSPYAADINFVAELKAMGVTSYKSDPSSNKLEIQF